LGEIPIVHIPNLLVSSSPWGLSDTSDITGLNRQYNETATALADIINYHCVDPETEMLTQRGWLKWNEVTTDDQALCLDADTDEISWGQVAAVNAFEHDGPLVRWDNHIDALTTPGHRWLVDSRYGRKQTYPLHKRRIARTSQPEGGDQAVCDLPGNSRIIVGGGVAVHFPLEPKWHDEFVETVGWWVTEGCIDPLPSGSKVSYIHQSERINPLNVGEIRRLQTYWKGQGGTFTEQRVRPDGVVGWYLGTQITEALEVAAPNKALSPEFLSSLTYQQAATLRWILMAADGTGTTTWYQDDQGRKDGFQMLCAMVDGQRTNSSVNIRGNGVIGVYSKRAIYAMETVARAREEENPAGFVWCPTVPTGIWMARRNGNTYWTGNSAPTTIVVGAKANQLEKGAKKVWSIPNKDAQVYNLELGDPATLANEFLDRLKSAMHEMTGIPVTALGQEQAVSNTSGVALQVQYQPTMQRWHQKTMLYGAGYEKINYLALRTLVLKEPGCLVYDPMTSPPLAEDQLPRLDPRDPNTYRTKTHFPSPLPIDQLIKLNELMAKMQLGLESKVGALRELGEEFPREKLLELMQELQDDVKWQGVMDLLRAQVADVIALSTFSGAAAMGGGDGGTSDGAAPVPPGPGNVASAGGSEVTSAAGGSPASSPAAPLPGLQPDADTQDLMVQLSNLSMGTKLPQRRMPNSNEDDDSD
jgi:hypothetical protein